MICQEGGRWRSEETVDERQTEIDEIISKMEPDEIKALEAVLGEVGVSGTSQIADTCAELEWEEVPLPIEEWLDSYHHIGDLKDSIYPVLKQDMIELFKGNYHEVILTGSTRWGKDFFSTTCMTRLLYELCCLRDPAQSMGLGAGESIHVVPISRTTQQARRIVFGGIASKLNLAPWWRGRFKETLDYIEFPDKKITIVGGASGDASALGLNVYTALVDEGNFMGMVKASEAAKSAGGKVHDRAQMICDALVRRIQGTYRHSGVKGMLFLISSKRATDDFTERRIREHIKQGTTSGVFVRDYATWHVRPEPFKRQKWYRCSVSAAEGRCRVLENDESGPEDAIVFDFPHDFLEEFKRDPAGCFTGDTKISLLDGREIPIADLAKEQEFWTYSFAPDGRFYPGRGHSARLTKRNASVVEVELDNGEKVRCTPDHRFMLRDGTFLPALALESGTSLMPLHRKLDKWGYEMLQSNVGGKWCHTHRLVQREAHNGGDRISRGTVVHHENFDKRDNRPVNLRSMLKEEHDRLHSQFLSEGMHSPAARRKARVTLNEMLENDPNYRAKVLGALAKGQALYVGSEKHRQTASDNGKKYGFGDKTNPNIAEARSHNGTRNITALNNSGRNPARKPENRRAASIRLKQMSKTTRHEATMAGLHSRWGHEGRPKGCERCQSKFVVGEILAGARDRLSVTATARRIGVSTSNLCYWLKREGLPTFAKLRDGALWENYTSVYVLPPNNHKVVAVRPAGRADVYDISVDGIQTFSLSAGVVVHNSTRDIAGIATDTYAPFVADRQAIERMFDINRPQVFSATEWDMGMAPLTINWEEVITKNARNENVPCCCSSASRHVHIDLSKNYCATGFNLCHQAGMTEVVRTDPFGNKSIEEAPLFHIDGMLRIIAGSANEIDHSEVRGLIYKLNEGGFNIRSVSMDHWMSVPNMQLLKKQGYRVAEISTVKKIDPFDTARGALYENRIVSPSCERLAEEIRSLELDPRRPEDRPKVIVQPGHSKDLADAWAGGIYYLATNATGGVMAAPTVGGSITPASTIPGGDSGRGSNFQWNKGEILFTDEEGYEDWEDESGSGGSGGAGEPHEQAWIV